MGRQLKEPQLARGDTPGIQLAAARAKRQLSQQQIADELNLNPTVIASLEADDYSGLPMAFVRGYQRSYGKLVGLNDQTLFGESPPASREIPITLDTRRRAALKPRRSGNWGTGVAMAILVGVIASSAWWTITQSQFEVAHWLSVFQNHNSSERILISAPPPIETHIETKSVDGGPPSTELPNDERRDTSATAEQVAVAVGSDVAADAAFDEAQPLTGSAAADGSPINGSASTKNPSDGSVNETTAATGSGSAITASAETSCPDSAWVDLLGNC